MFCFSSLFSRCGVRIGYYLILALFGEGCCPDSLGAARSPPLQLPLRPFMLISSRLGVISSCVSIGTTDSDGAGMESGSGAAPNQKSLRYMPQATLLFRVDSTWGFPVLYRPSCSLAALSASSKFCHAFVGRIDRQYPVVKPYFIAPRTRSS